MALRFPHLVLAVAAAAGCGDNHGAADAGTSPPAAMIVSGDLTPGDPGVLAKLDIGAMSVTPGLAPAGAVGDDTVLRRFGSELFLINRADGANVTILDAATRAVVAQLATGAGSDPQDVAVVGDKLYVPVYGGTGVAVLTRGSPAIATIDLSADDPDGKPQCMSAMLAGTDVYVTCQLLDASAAPRGNGRVYVIDSATDTVRTSFALTTKNPISLLEEVGDGSLAVATVDFADHSGCIEKFVPGASPTSACITSNTLLGGYATRLQFQQLADDGRFLWAAVRGFDAAQPTGTLMAYDFTSAELWPPISTPDELVGDVGLCPDGTIVIADHTPGAAGVRAYQEATEVTTAALSIGLSPASPHGIECY